MKINHTQQVHTYRRRIKKPHRRFSLTGILAVAALLFCGYEAIIYFTDVPTFSVEADAARTPLNKDVRFAWPVIGQAAMGSVEDGIIAHSSNKEEQRPTASMAKVIAALAIMKKQPFKPGQDGKSYTLTNEDVANYRAYVAKGGSALPVHAGMELTQYQAMQMMLIASANNIADMLTERIFGSEEAYISYAQAMLKDMELSRTVIADASGFSPATVSTPSDLVTIGIAALKNPVIAEIVSQSQAQIPSLGIIENTNELLGVDGVVGIKTGTTNQAGSCLLFAARYTAQGGHKVTIVGVIMGDKDAARLFNDSRQLLASAKQGFGLTGDHSTDDIVAPLPSRNDSAPRL